MAQKLGNVPVGTILHMKENGVYQDYLVVHQGIPSSMYDASCNGTWLLRASIYSLSSFGSSASYKNSTINSFLNGNFLQVLDAGMPDVIKTVKIPYVNGNGGGGPNSNIASGSNGLSVKCFILSSQEVGFSSTGEVPNDGAKLSYFPLWAEDGSGWSSRIFLYNSSPTNWYTRSPDPYQSNYAVINVSDYGGWGRNQFSSQFGVLPAFVFNPDALVDDSNNILAATYPTPPASITVPTSAIPSGSSISVSWSAVSGAESYQLQRSVDRGSWQTIYTGTQTSYSDTAGVWNSVKYQVATVKVGIVSGYTTSTAVTILPYTIDKLTVPSQIMEGQTVPISWSAAPAATTYILERKVNSGSWTQIYSGANKSYTDTPSGGWSTVQYRVKGGANGQYGTYRTSPSIPVISASALVISGTDGYLGTLTADIGYTVSSDTGNPISVERYVNGQLVAPLPVHLRHQQRLVRLLRWWLPRLGLLQHFWGSARFGYAIGSSGR